jgi:hypothetical protein
VTGLRPSVLSALLEKGVVPGEGDTPTSLKERLNEAYLAEVRALRERQRRGEIPITDFAAQADALKQSFALLGLPLPLWEEPEP